MATLGDRRKKVIEIVIEKRARYKIKVIDFRRIKVISGKTAIETGMGIDIDCCPGQESSLLLGTAYTKSFRFSRGQRLQVTIMVKIAR